MKRILSLILAVALVLSMVTAAYAAEDSRFSDVSANAWYAEAVAYCVENGIMYGTSNTQFSPNETMTRAMLVTALYRRTSSPAVSGRDSFVDTADGQWYTDAVLWASQNGIIAGYGSTQFGTNDPITREQLVTILYRIAGEPEAQAAEAFADQSSISDYAVSAVSWARGNGVVSGKAGNRFDPKGNATRAEVAAVLINEAKKTEATPTPAPSPTPSPSPRPNPVLDQESKVLVAYFSATGSTGRVAEYIAAATNGDLFELIPAEPYTSEDLNYGNSSSRVVYEHEHPEAQDIELANTTPDNWDEYDVIFIGYPIWWHAAAWPVNHFVADNDFTGKTVIPFCTSASSPLEGSDEKLAAMTDTGDWCPGQRFSSGASQSTVENWVNSLETD